MSYCTQFESIRKSLMDLTHDYQAEFDKINEFMGCFNDKLAELESRIKSLENTATN